MTTLAEYHREEREARRTKRDFRAEWERRMRIKAEQLAARANVEAPEEFPVRRPLQPKQMVNDRTLASRMESDAAWQAAHEKRMQALQRLGLDERNDFSLEYHGSDGAAKRIAARAQEDAHDPRAELLASARAGDKNAIRRADCLYDNWRRA